MKIIATQPIERKALSTLEHPRHHANSRGQDDVPESVRGRQRFRLELQRSKWLPASARSDYIRVAHKPTGGPLLKWGFS